MCCGRKEDLPAFEQAFNEFFVRPAGVVQADAAPSETISVEIVDADDQDAETTLGLEDDTLTDAASWDALVAKYSAAAGTSPAPAIAEDGLDEMLRAARRLIASVHLGRSRRWRPSDRGRRFDIRRTLRASLHTGGDPVALRRLDHPRRNARFILLIDGSRSMAEHGALTLQFAYALIQRTPRARAFVFSTDLHHVTRELRTMSDRNQRRLQGLGEAWGGGTRIGANLLRFVREHGARLRNDDTVTIIVSDGLDTGDTGQLARAMRAIRRRSAAVIWVNPHAATPGYRPATAGMRTALPYLTALVSAPTAKAFGELWLQTK